MYRLILALVLAATAACATLTPEQRAAREEARYNRKLERIRTETTICVSNQTAAMGNLYGGEWGGNRHAYDVMGGHTDCRQWNPTGRTEITLYLETIGGGAWGPTQVWATLPLRAGACWMWEVRNDMSSDGWIQCYN